MAAVVILTLFHLVKFALTMDVATLIKLAATFAARQVRSVSIISAAQILVAITLPAVEMVRFVQITALAVTTLYALAGKFVQIAATDM